MLEPHQPELCNFTPTTPLDITPVIEKKSAPVIWQVVREL
jgi:hypothetical protein